MVILCLNFLRNHQTPFHRGSIILHSYQQCLSVPIFPRSQQYLLVFLFVCLPACLFWIIAILITILSVKWHFIVVLICVLMSREFEHLFMYYWPFVYLLWRNTYFSNGLIVLGFFLLLLLLRCRTSLYIMDINLLDIWFASIFLNSVWCVLHS